jgi:hypothetical protein
MDRRLIVIALGVILGGTSAGYALGGYATGGRVSSETSDREAWWREEASTSIPQAPAETAAPPTVASPEHYTCHGCGPTLAERRQQAMWGPATGETAYADPPVEEGSEGQF